MHQLIPCAIPVLAKKVYERLTNKGNSYTTKRQKDGQAKKIIAQGNKESLVSFESNDPHYVPPTIKSKTRGD